MNELIKSEELTYEQRKARIKKNIKSFLVVAADLLHIKENKEYKHEYKTFEEFCRAEFNISRSYAHRLIQAKVVDDNLLPIGNKPSEESHYRELAKLPAEQQAPAWEKATETAPNNIPTAKHIANVVREIKSEEADREARAIIEQAPTPDRYAGEFEVNNIYCADVSAPDFLSMMPSSSVDFIFTDPPWGEDERYTFDALGKLANKVLKPGSWLLSYSGKMFLPDSINALAKHLVYGWTFGVFQPDSNDRINKFHLYSAWRPILAFYAGGAPPRVPIWTPDSTRTTRDKSYHEWGQGIEPVEKWMKAFTNIGDLVMEPFCGGGSVPFVAKKLERKYIAFDKSSDAVAISAERLRNA